MLSGSVIEFRTLQLPPNGTTAETLRLDQLVVLSNFRTRERAGVFVPNAAQQDQLMVARDRAIVLGCDVPTPSDNPFYPDNLLRHVAGIDDPVIRSLIEGLSVHPFVRVIERDPTDDVDVTLDVLDDVSSWRWVERAGWVLDDSWTQRTLFDRAPLADPPRNFGPFRVLAGHGLRITLTGRNNPAILLKLSLV